MFTIPNNSIQCQLHLLSHLRNPVRTLKGVTVFHIPMGLVACCLVAARVYFHQNLPNNMTEKAKLTVHIGGKTKQVLTQELLASDWGFDTKQFLKLSETVMETNPILGIEMVSFLISFHQIKISIIEMMKGGVNHG